MEEADPEGGPTPAKGEEVGTVCGGEGFACGSCIGREFLEPMGARHVGGPHRKKSIYLSKTYFFSLKILKIYARGCAKFKT
jgi:hypothetical protein